MIPGGAEGKARRQETPLTLEEWVGEIKNGWQVEKIPKYEVDPEKLGHLAIICDGNRRAAMEKGLDPWDGHRAGAEVIRGIAQAGREWGVQTLTFWIWSTENWKREEAQIRGVMGLAAKYLTDSRVVEEFHKEGVKFVHLGRKSKLPKNVLSAIASLEEQTAENQSYTLNMAMDYGGLDEVARAVDKIIEGIQEGTLNPELVQKNPQVILGFLDTAEQVLPDLVIRTGVKEGEIPHTSGFMPLQTAYSGWVFLPDLFPNLTPEILLEPITEFVDYERRMGR